MNRRNVFGLGLIALGGGIAASAIVGPLVLKLVKFRTSANLENQFLGGEVISLGLVAPAAVTAGILWLRGHRLAPALALAPTLYAVYTYTSVVLGQEYARYPGNVEKFFPLYAALVAGGAAFAAAAWSRLGQAAIPVIPSRLRRGLAIIFLGIGSLFALTWARQIEQVLTGHPMTEYLEGPTLFWVIKLLDLGFVIPASLATAIGLLRSRPAAIKAAYGLAGFLTCLVGSVAGMAAAMEIKHDPAASPMLLVIAGAGALTLTAATGQLVRAYLPPSDDGLTGAGTTTRSQRRRSHHGHTSVAPTADRQ